MGDMADDFLDQTIDTEDARSAFHHGELSLEEAYDLGIVDETGSEPDRKGVQDASSQ
jgi:hypothetical protein